jgi:hypothetical protein
MSEVCQSLSHSEWECLSRCIRAQTAEGHLRPYAQAVGRDLSCLGSAKGVPDQHAYMCIAIPPKVPAASVIGFLKGKSAIAIARLMWQELETFRASIPGPRVRSIQRRVRTGAGPQLHPRTENCGWSRRSVLKQRATPRDLWPNRL